MADSLYAHASYYRMLHHERRADLERYLALTQGRARVLEYGVGYGRVALPMARRGQHVVGVDSSAEMLECLRAELREEPEEVRERLRIVHADARELVLAERFDAVTCPFNGIAHHHDLDQLGAFLGRVAQHLAPDGIFVFDVAVPSPGLLVGTSTEIPWFRDPDDGTVCRATERYEYDVPSQVLGITITTRPMEGEGGPREMTLQLRQLFPMETQLLLRHHQFVIERCDASLGDVLLYVCRYAPGAPR